MNLSTVSTPKPVPFINTLPKLQACQLPPLLAILKPLALCGTPATPRYALQMPTPTLEPARDVANLSAESDESMNDLMARARKRLPARDFAFISHLPATYPSQEPAIDNALLARRKRRRTLPNELAILNLEFDVGQTPSKQRRQEIARRVCMLEKAVQIWFQNKRQLVRRLRQAEREVTELPATPEALPLLELTPIKRPRLALPERADGPSILTFNVRRPLANITNVAKKLEREEKRDLCARGLLSLKRARND